MKLEEIRVLCEKATAGPWRYEEPFVQQNAGVDGFRDIFRTKGDDRQEEDAAFVVAARTLMPLLLDVAKAATEMWSSRGDTLIDSLKRILVFEEAVKALEEADV